MEVEAWLLYRGEWRFVGLRGGLLREWGLLCATCLGDGAVPAEVGAGLEQAELKEIECELPAACREAGKVSREPASEPGGHERQLVSEPELVLFLFQGPELQDRAGLCSLPSLSICLHLREK